MLTLIIVLYICAFKLAIGQFSEVDGQPSLKIPQGTLVGNYRTTVHNVPYVAFEGIPYAQPPLGDLRFKGPIAAEKWTAILNATEKGPICVQINVFEVELPTFPTGVPLGDENCLHLNVYAPATCSNKKLPILVHVHGGGFVSGAPDLANPETIVEKGIVFIGISYRLGVFGFLSLNSTLVPGNAGLKDVALAMKWIRDNAEYFNGDSEQVSVIGESAGAAIAQCLQLSPLTKGLFQKVLLVGGTGMSGWAYSDLQRNPVGKAASLASILSLDFNSPNFLSDLQSLDAYTLCIASFQTPGFVPGMGEDFSFTPVIETKFPGQKAFLSEDPLDLFLSGEFYDVPTLLGYASKEFAYFFLRSLPMPYQAILQQPRAVVPIAWQSILTEGGIFKVYREIMEFFFKGETIDLTNRKQAESTVDLFSDVVIIRSVDQMVRTLTEKSRQPIYYYRFSYRGGLNARFNEGTGIQGASHINELYYLWQLEEIPVDDYSSDGWVRRRIVAMFTNFIKFGDPTPGPCNDLLPTTWLPVSHCSQNYMSISGDIIPSLDPDICRMKFWRELENHVYDGYYNKT